MKLAQVAAAVDRPPKDQSVRRILTALGEEGLARCDRGWWAGCQVSGVKTPRGNTDDTLTPRENCEPCMRLATRYGVRGGCYRHHRGAGDAALAVAAAEVERDPALEWAA
jgi:hypothetical protein